MSDWLPAPASPAPIDPLPTAPWVAPRLPRGGVWKPQDIPPDLSPLGLHIGTGGYSFDDWDGRFYPPAAGERLPFYQMYFSFLELNHTFYQEPLMLQFAQLERRSKPGMLYSVKVHRDVSHKGTWDAREGKTLMRRHAAAVGPIADNGHFYSFLIQLDEGVERRRQVLDYLLATAGASVSAGLDVHIEFRNRTWHQEPVLQALKDAGIGICNTDLPPLLHTFPLRAYATTAKAYVRYCGRNLEGWRAAAGGEGLPGSPRERLRARNARYDYTYGPRQLEELAEGQFRMLHKTGAVAAVFKNHVGGQAAFDALAMIRLLAAKARTA